MNQISARTRWFTPRRALMFALVVIGFGVLTLLDHRLVSVLCIDPDKSLEGKDWWQVLRQFGSLITWAIIALFVMAHDLRVRSRGSIGQRECLPGVTPIARPAPRSLLAGAASWRGASTPWHLRGLLIFLSAGLGGALAELVKVIAQRSRPMGDMVYHWRWTDAHVTGLGLASSHTGVAFGGVFMLAYCFPGVRIPAVLLACATAFTRLAVGAHYATDVYAAIVLSYAGYRLVRLLAPR